MEEPRHRVIWKSPQGLLKLNFDRSYLRSICRGSIEGAIRVGMTMLSRAFLRLLLKVTPLQRFNGV